MINKKINAFTLVELVVTIAIMLTIVVIAIPSIINLINKNKQKSYDLYIKEFESAAEKYVLNNTNKWNIDNIKKSGEEYCFSLSDLLSAGYIKEIPKDPIKEDEIFNGSVEIKITNVEGKDRLKFIYSDIQCTDDKKIINSSLDIYENYDEDLYLENFK